MLTDKEIYQLLNRVILTRVSRETKLGRVVLTKMRQGKFKGIRDRTRQKVTDFYENILK